MDILKFISENFAILVPVVWILGMYLKNSPKVPDWLIPWILTIVSVLLSFGVERAISVDALIQGILVSGGAVLVHQLIKQSAEKGA